MNKKAYHPVGIVGLIFVIVVIFGIIGFFEEDIPEISAELKNDICLPIQGENSICFVNESGIRLNGQFENYRFELDREGIKSLCYIDSHKYNFEQVCKNEFGYLYQKNDFILNLLVNGKVVKTIPKYEVYNLFYRVLKNPKLSGKVIKDSGEGFFIRGVIYLAEHPDVLNMTNQNNTKIIF